MTVCIAGIHDGREHSTIFLTCDRRISLFGGWFSQDSTAKYSQVHQDWIGMFAGGIEKTALMLKEVNRSLAALSSVPLDKAVDCSRMAYTKVRRRLVETQILPDFDVSTYREYKKLEKSDEALYLTIKERIRDAEEKWSLLFAGFDNERAAHLFVISGPGRVEYCDKQRYAAIGSGSLAALIWLSFCGYQSRKDAGELLFQIMSAKFFAEKASDVGETTVVSTITSDASAIFHWSDHEVIKVRKVWEQMPKISKEAADELAANLRQRSDMYKSFTAAQQQPTERQSQQQLRRAVFLK